ncbi:hypothetical protein Tco_1341190, partial [Tanacetum coccineum]
MEVIKDYMQKLVQKIGHRVTNADRSVRIEDVLRISNEERRRITANRISCLFLLIGVCIVIFLVGAYVLLSYGLPYIKKADVVDVDMRLGIINDTSISLETKLSLQPYFQKRVNLKLDTYWGPSWVDQMFAWSCPKCRKDDSFYIGNLDQYRVEK